MAPPMAPAGAPMMLAVTIPQGEAGIGTAREHECQRWYNRAGAAARKHAFWRAINSSLMTTDGLNPPPCTPPGVGPGSTITVANPHGGTMNVTVPPNTPPGTVIHVQAPQQQPIVMVQVATVQQPPEPIAVTATVVKQGF